jgi:hypothetical protein
MKDLRLWLLVFQLRQAGGKMEVDWLSVQQWKKVGNMGSIFKY